ncbi:ATP-binding cassette domain-containing protein [Mucilaginibacter limnophilus]|uniref:ATP-binding cassette domain-containing protein n=1 Tax=Mucilaginibacter limnophilus TaxID=1932778 RepID=A0A437MSA2_9SPHI|nr:ATP-binding cassette domain-containing protein [Mucilaginibacter limnophilus]RVU00544.1 ATP-binding cassette domain-containing protein [Mucilaginibacter limnophilus]
MNTDTLAPNFLSLKDVTIRLFDKILFDKLTFNIAKGQHWALTGPSGSGKSVLLQAIAGKLNIIHGEVTLDFYTEYCTRHPHLPENFTFHQLVVLVEPKHHFKNLSNTTEFYYQQRYNSSDSEDALTVSEYLWDIKPVIGNDYWTLEKVTELLNLAPLRDKQLIKLSNGETKRLRLASALLKNPLLLLLDNPLAGLDVQSRAEFNVIIEKIIASGITVVLTSSPAEVPLAVTHVAVLDQGTIKETFTRADYHFDIQHEELFANADEVKALIGEQANVDFNHIINMQNVNIRYGDNIVLQNVNWEVKPGERWALLGANGAGKSTLLSLVNGDNPQAYANHIVLFDKRRGSGESIWDIKKKIGFVSPELYQYFPADNSCLQVIESGYYDTIGLFRQSNKTLSDKALQWMKVLEIGKYARVPLRNIPAAVQRLCLLARALVKNPPLLIFDEPCQGLDSHQQEHFKQVVDTICRISNVTLIYVTHYQHEIPDSVDKVLRLEKGKVV